MVLLTASLPSAQGAEGIDVDWAEPLPTEAPCGGQKLSLSLLQIHMSLRLGSGAYSLTSIVNDSV